MYRSRSMADLAVCVVVEEDYRYRYARLLEKVREDFCKRGIAGGACKVEPIALSALQRVLARLALRGWRCANLPATPVTL